MPSVSVVIPARRAAGGLPRALHSIAGQTYENIIEVIVAAADHESAGAADGAVVIDNPSGDTATGLNLAIAKSSGDIIVRCDARSILPPDYVATAVEIMRRTGADNVGGMQVPSGDTEWEVAIGAAMSSPWGAGDARYRIGGTAGPAETVYLGVFKRRTLDLLGGYDESFRRTQDYELNHRIIEAGGLVWFDPSLAVTYRPRGSLSDLARQYFDYGVAKRQFSRKHRRHLRWRQTVPPVTLLVLTAAIGVSIWYPPALVVPVGYVLSVVGAGLATPAPWWRVAPALAVMHLGWGAGFLVGGRR